MQKCENWLRMAVSKMGNLFQRLIFCILYFVTLAVSHFITMTVVHEIQGLNSNVIFCVCQKNT